MLRRTFLLIACAACLALPNAAMALGFGRSTSVAVLGQNLDFRIPLTLEAGETLLPECFSIEVIHGESRLEPQAVRYSLDAETAGGVRMLNVRTLVPIEELVVQLNVGVGCPPRFSRRYTLFPDPPTVRLAQGQDNNAAPPAETAGVPIAQADSAAAQPPVQPAAISSTARPSKLGAPSPSHAVSRRANTTAPRSVVRRNAPASATAAVAASRVATATAPSKSAAPRTPASDGASRLVLDPITPRLKLDIDEPVFMGVAAIAAAAASDAAAANADAVQADVERLKAMERTLTQLKQETQAQRADVGRLQAQLRQAQADQRWLPWLAGLLALCLAAIVWLAWRLRSQTSAAQWWAPADDAADAAEPDRAAVAAVKLPATSEDDGDEPDESPLTRVQATLPPDDVEWPPAKAAAPATVPLPLRAPVGDEVDAGLDWKTTTAVRRGEPVVQREVAVEELLDLEQQADFFIALGQEEAAVELLMSHLRSTKGMSPLPYTQWLEIYRRRGDREAYERIRSRFNRQFNAHAPDWEDGPGKGRNLEDYPAIVERLQAHWAMPAESMKALESMLIRRDDNAELFDLPAYRDVLMLYALARDLLQQRDDAPRDVDVLLPIGPDTTMSGDFDTDHLGFDLTTPSAPPPSSATQAGSFGPTDQDPTFDIKLR